MTLDERITELECEVTQLKELLRVSYDRIPENRKGTTRCIDFDPAGSTYEFTEHEWSQQIRALLKITHEPIGM